MTDTGIEQLYFAVQRGDIGLNGFKKSIQAALESSVLAERQPVAVIGRDWQLLWASPVSLKEIVDRHNLKIGTPLFTHPTPDDAKRVVTDTMLTAAVGAFMKCEGTFTESIRAAIAAAMQADKETK